MGVSPVRESGGPCGCGVPLGIGMSPAAVRDGDPCEHGFVAAVRGSGSLRAGDGGSCEQVVPVGRGLSPVEGMRVPKGRGCSQHGGEDSDSEFSWRDLFPPKLPSARPRSTLLTWF